MKAESSRLYSLEEKRLARLLRRAALQHVRREHALAAATLAEARTLVAWAARPAWAFGLEFLGQWRETVKAEHEGKVPATAPAAWIHLSQELASLLESGGDWIAYLRGRWKLEAGRISVRKRVLLGLLGSVTLLLSALMLWLTVRGLVGDPIARLSLSEMGRDSLLGALLALGRLLGILLMVEHGVLWARKAVTGKSDEPEVTFLGGTGGGLTLISP